MDDACSDGVTDAFCWHADEWPQESEVRSTRARDDTEHGESLHPAEVRGDHNEISHVSMAALAVSIVVLAGLVLVYVSRHVHQHPGAVLVVLLGLPTLVVLMIIIAKRRRARA